MEEVVVLDAAAPSARLNVGRSVLGGLLVEGGRQHSRGDLRCSRHIPLALAEGTGEDGRSSHALGSLQSPRGIMEGPSAAPASMGFISGVGESSGVASCPACL